MDYQRAMLDHLPEREAVLAGAHSALAWAREHVKVLTRG